MYQGHRNFLSMPKVDMKLKFLFFDMKVQGKLETKPLSFSKYLSQFQRYQRSKKCKMVPKVVHQNMAHHQTFGENCKICDINRFACLYLMNETL